MTFFWDKNIAKTIPLALLTLNLPVGTEYYLKHWPSSDQYPEGGDDRWLSQVGSWGWVVISRDYQFHEKENERYALKQYNIGCFYLWGAEAVKWETMRCFARAYDRIIAAAQKTPGPYIYWVSRMGRLTSQPIP